MRRTSLKIKGLAAALSVGLFATNVLWAYTPETNFWKERRKTPASPVQLASLPQNFSPASIFNPVQLSPAIRSSILSTRAKSEFLPIIQKIPQATGTTRKITAAHGERRGTVIYIQDVHRNAEAQQNIGKTIQALMEQKAVDAVALEGAFSPIDFSWFHSYPHQDVVKSVADYLFKEMRITGPVHAAFVNSSSPTRVLGVDDKFHYDANVSAYRAAAASKPALQKEWQKESRELATTKFKTFNPELKKFDAMVAAYHDGSLAWGDYVRGLAERTDDFSPKVDAFLTALDMEKKLNFNQVERERTKLLTQLAGALNPNEVKDLLDHSGAYRSGILSNTDFYSYLKSLSFKKGFYFSRYPAMDEYVRYVLLSDSLDVDAISTETNSAEKKIYAALAKTDEEHRLVQKVRISFLTGKLLDFSLTNEEWTEYKRSIEPAKLFGRSDSGSVERSPNNFAGFISFYREAEIRDRKMAENFERQTLGLRSQTLNSKQGVAVLVTGGFHSAGITRLLAEKGFAVISFVPKISKVQDENGSAYLSMFTQEKTPLDKLFAGEKLFLGQPPMVSVPVAEVMTDLRNSLLHPGTSAPTPTGVSGAELATRKVEGETASMEIDGQVITVQENPLNVTSRQNIILPSIGWVVFADLQMNQGGVGALDWFWNCLIVFAFIFGIVFFVGIFTWLRHRDGPLRLALAIIDKQIEKAREIIAESTKPGTKQEDLGALIRQFNYLMRTIYFVASPADEPRVQLLEEQLTYFERSFAFNQVPFKNIEGFMLNQIIPALGAIRDGVNILFKRDRHGNLPRRAFMFAAAGSLLGFEDIFAQGPAVPTADALKRGSFKYNITEWKEASPFIDKDRAFEGKQNVKVVDDRSLGKMLEISYPKDSVDPSWAEAKKGPYGGAIAYLPVPPSDKLHFAYYLEFDKDFEFARGGKLPGFFGGKIASGGVRAENSFSTRYMWIDKGNGKLYLYDQDPLEKNRYGKPVGEGKFSFEPGGRYHIEQAVTLNTPGKADGKIEIWFNGELVHTETGIVFRTDASGKISHIDFETFFGGDDESWKSPKTQHLKIGGLEISTKKIGMRPGVVVAPNPARQGVPQNFNAKLIGGNAVLKWDPVKLGKGETVKYTVYRGVGVIQLDDKKRNGPNTDGTNGYRAVIEIPQTEFKEKFSFDQPIHYAVTATIFDMKGKKIKEGRLSEQIIVKPAGHESPLFFKEPSSDSEVLLATGRIIVNMKKLGTNVKSIKLDLPIDGLKNGEFICGRLSRAFGDLKRDFDTLEKSDLEDLFPNEVNEIPFMIVSNHHDHVYMSREDDGSLIIDVRAFTELPEPYLPAEIAGELRPTELKGHIAAKHVVDEWLMLGGLPNEKIMNPGYEAFLVGSHVNPVTAAVGAIFETFTLKMNLHFRNGGRADVPEMLMRLREAFSSVVVDDGSIYESHLQTLGRISDGLKNGHSMEAMVDLLSFGKQLGEEIKDEILSISIENDGMDSVNGLGSMRNGQIGHESPLFKIQQDIHTRELEPSRDLEHMIWLEEKSIGRSNDVGSALNKVFNTPQFVPQLVYVNDPRDILNVQQAVLAAKPTQSPVAVILTTSANEETARQLVAAMDHLSTETPLGLIREDLVEMEDGARLFTSAFLQLAEDFRSIEAQNIFRSLAGKDPKGIRLIVIGSSPTPYRATDQLRSIMLFLAEQDGQFLFLKLQTALEASENA